MYNVFRLIMFGVEGKFRMDKIYMVLLLLMIIPILICIRYARKIKSDVAASIVKCLVFAIITILSNGLFVFSIDETFAYFDNARLEKIIQYLNEKAKEHQTIIFTCTNREKEILDNLKIEYNYIEL